MPDSEDARLSQGRGHVLRHYHPAQRRARVRQVGQGAVNRYTGEAIGKVAGIEAPSFILGAALAHQLGVGFVPVRKQGKLPDDTIEYHYDFECGTDSVEIHTDAILDGYRVPLVDDLIASCGTAEGEPSLIQRSGGTVVECCFIIDLLEVGGGTRLEKAGRKVFSLCAFESE